MPCLLFCPGAWGATAASRNAHNWTGNLTFSAGGLSGRFLVFDDWVNNKDYTLNTIIKHSNAIWVALIDPATGDEPGVSANWEKITDQTAASGTGASITAGTADPTGGADGDAYLQVNATDVVQSIWRNASGTWTEYTVPAGGGGGSGDITAVHTTGGNSGLDRAVRILGAVDP